MNMIISMIIYSVLKLYLILTIYQQAHYHIKQYSKHFLINFVFYNLIPLFLLLIGDIISQIGVTIMCSIFITVFSSLYLFTKVPLKFTKRIWIITTLSIIYIVGVSFIPFVNNYLLLIIEFSIIPMFILEKGLSYLFNRKYLLKAKNKMFSYKGYIIGITGSAGKTTTKNLLDQALSLYKTVSSTPKSYNTPLGISSHINNIDLEPLDYLILEFGTSAPHDIKKLKNIAPPNIAFITDIGYMHMEGFKTENRLIKEKLSILEGTYKAVVNYDVDWIRENIDYNGILITYGFKYGDYIASNMCNGRFDVLYKGNKIGTFECGLIGRHQILNMTGIIAFIHSEGLEVERLVRGIPMFKGTPNRMEIKNIGNVTILDDSYNSNPKGFIEALAVVKESVTPRFLITPGIVELGKYKNSIYDMLVKNIIDSVDTVILVGKHNTRYLYKQLSLTSVNLFLVSSFKEGYKLFSELSLNYEKCSLLIENDIPDLYRVGMS